MKITDRSQLLKCPYNQSHVFEKQKFIFHLNRCKDREKVGHLYAPCRHNRMHIYPKQSIELHQLTCPDKQKMEELTLKLRKTASQVEAERQRSRDKLKREEMKRENQPKKEIKEEVQQAKVKDDNVYYQNCLTCMCIHKKFQQMKNIVGPETLAKMKKVEKYLRENEKITKMLQELQNNN